jgi:hypothetical protein
MKLNEIYTKILAALHVHPTPEGLLSYHAFDGPTPLMVTDGDKKRRLALATNDVLQAADWDHIVAFHPLSEHLNRGVSPVMNALVRTGMIRLTEVISSLIHQLLELAVDQSRHAKVAPAAQGILSVLPDVDKKTLANITEVLSRVDMSPDRRLVSIYLKRKGVYRGITSRLCVVSFPIMDELSRGDRKIWGVSLRVKDVDALEALMNYILPGCDNAETYSAPSDSKAAPYFESFLEAYEKVTDQLNRVIHVNRKELQDVDKLKTVKQWENLSEDLLTHRTEIPALEGNKGTVLSDGQLDTVVPTEQVTPTTPAPYHAPAPVTTTPMRPYTPPPVAAPAPATNMEELPLAQRLAQRQQQLAAPQGYYPPPPGYAAPPPPGYPPQPYPPQPYPPQPYPMAQAPYPNQPYPAAPYPPQPYPNQPYPGQPYPPQANQPVWLNNPSATTVVAATPAPMPQYPGAINTGGGGVLF